MSACSNDARHSLLASQSSAPTRAHAKQTQKRKAADSVSTSGAPPQKATRAVREDKSVTRKIAIQPTEKDKKETTNMIDKNDPIDDKTDANDDNRPARGPGCVYLKVPYDQKEEAKTSFNCQWDPDVGHWYTLDADSDAALQKYKPATVAQIRAGRHSVEQKRKRREASSQILANSAPHTPIKGRMPTAAITLDDVDAFLNKACIEDVLKAAKLTHKRKQEVMALLQRAVKEDNIG